MKDDGRGFVLSTGRWFYATGGMLCPDDELRLHYGSDGRVDVAEPGEDFRPGPPFTPEERQEIAEHMIARWRAWADQQRTKEPGRG